MENRKLLSDDGLAEETEEEICQDEVEYHDLNINVGDRGNKRGASFEAAVEATGYGRFHVMLLIVCGWAVSSDAVEILGISFILPPATCDLNLTDQDKGWINSSVFIGMMIGGLFWGTLADIKGRRAVLLWSLSVNALGGLASSFVQTTWVFILCRLISGIGVGGSMPVIFSYFVEFQPKERRGSAISMLATFWMTGNILAAALAWAIIPIEFELSSTSGFSYSSWRLYLALCVLPSATSVCLYVLMPESPKYLLRKGETHKALQVFQQMYCCNFKAKDPHEYPITSLASEEDKDSSRGTDYVTNASLPPVVVRAKHSIIRFWSSVKGVFGGDLKSRSAILVIIYFTLSFGFYGLFMWLPELFHRIEILGGNPCRAVTHPNTPSNVSTVAPLYDCEVSSKVFFEGFLTALSNLPGNILTIFIIDRVGRKILLSLSMMASGVCVFFLYLVESSVAGLIMSCLFSGVSVIGWNALDVLQAELYPTKVRSTASGVLMSIGRVASILANLVFGQLIGLNCAVPMVSVAVLLFVGGLSSIKLPNMTNHDLL